MCTEFSKLTVQFAPLHRSYPAPERVSFLSWPIVPFHSVLFLHKLVSVFIVVIYINLLIVFYCDRFCHAFTFSSSLLITGLWKYFEMHFFVSPFWKALLKSLKYCALLETGCFVWFQHLVPFFYWKIILNSTSESHWIIACYTFIFEQSWFGWFLNMLTYNRKSLKSRHFAFVYVQAADGVDIDSLQNKKIFNVQNSSKKLQ